MSTNARVRVDRRLFMAGGSCNRPGRVCERGWPWCSMKLAQVVHALKMIHAASNAGACSAMAPSSMASGDRAGLTRWPGRSSGGTTALWGLRQALPRLARGGEPAIPQRARCGAARL